MRVNAVRNLCALYSCMYTNIHVQTHVSRWSRADTRQQMVTCRHTSADGHVQTHVSRWSRADTLVHIHAMLTRISPTHTCDKRKHVHASLYIIYARARTRSYTCADTSVFACTCPFACMYVCTCVYSYANYSCKRAHRGSLDVCAPAAVLLLVVS